MSHRNAPLTPQRRLLLCRRIEAGATIAQVAEAMGLSRHCASKWRRYVELGVAACMTAPAVLAAAHPPAREPRSQDLPRRRVDKAGPDRLAVRLRWSEPKTLSPLLGRAQAASTAARNSATSSTAFPIRG